MRRCLYVVAALLVLGAMNAQSLTPRQDANKVVVTKTVESWYKILQGDEHVGFAHEWLSPAQNKDYAYDYEYEVQLEIRVQEKVTEAVSERMTAKLRPNFLAETITSTYSVGAMTIPYDLMNTAEGRKVVLTLPSSERRSFSLRDDEEVHFTLPLLTYWLRQNDHLAGRGEKRAMFFIPMATDKTGSNTFEIKVEMVENESKHKVMDKDSFATHIRIGDLPSASKGMAFTDCWVDKFGRVVEIANSGTPTIKMTLVSDRQAAIGKMNFVRPGGRRDPFRKDLVMTARGKNKGPRTDTKGPDTTITKDNIGATLKQVEEDIAKLAKSQDPDSEKRKAYRAILTTIKAMRAVVDQNDPVMKRRVEALKDSLELAYAGAEKVVLEARELYQQAVEVDARNDDLKGMEEKQKKMRDMLGLEEFVGGDVGAKKRDQIKELVDLLEKEKAKVKDRVELAKKKLLLSGTLTSMEGQPEVIDIAITVAGHAIRINEMIPFMNSNTLAVVNGKYYKVGDKIEGEGVPVELIEIQKYGIKVKYKDQIREVGMKE